MARSFADGEVVLIEDLIGSEARFNGMHGKVDQFSRKANRYSIALKDGTKVLLKADNCSRLDGNTPVKADTPARPDASAPSASITDSGQDAHKRHRSVFKLSNAISVVAIALVVFLSGTEPTIALGGANALFQQQQWSLPSSVVGRARPTEQDDQEPAELQEPPPLQEPPQLQEPLPSPAPFARWLPQLRPDGCSDEHKTCAGWAAVGECKRNAKFMSTTCRLSCGLCDDLGRVERTQVEVSVSPAMPMSVQPSPVPMAASSSAKGCYDIHPRCAEFVAAGECTRNAHYMHAKCAASCDACEEIAAMEAAARAARRMSSSSRRRS